MANDAISQLPPVFSLNGTEQVPILVYLGSDPVTPTTVRVASSILASGPTSSSQSANTVYAGPTSGSAAGATFRALVDADIPDVLSITTLTVSGTATVGTLTQTGTIAANLLMAGPASGAAAAPAYRALVNADIPTSLSIASLTLSGNATVGGNASVTGTLGVTGAATVGSLGTVGSITGGSLTSTGAATIAGACSAASFAGSGASLTALPYSQLSGTGAANTLLYNSALNTPNALATANSSVLVTSSAGVPSLSSTLPPVTLTAGTTALAPITLTAGTNLTAAAAGKVEYDGVAKYFTPAATNRGVSQTLHFLSLAADQTGTNVNTAQTIFPGGGSTTITVPSSTTYIFEGVYTISSTGTTSRTISLLFGGSATFTTLRYTAVASNGTTGTTQSTVTTVSTAATATAITAAVAAATVNVITVRGMIRVNAGGTIIPQFQYSAAPGVAPTVAGNSFFRMYAVGSNTVLNVGQWS